MELAGPSYLLMREKMFTFALMLEHCLVMFLLLRLNTVTKVTCSLFGITILEG